jgi:hypothetical protein
VTCSVPIYIPGEFQSIWRPPSVGPNYLGLQSSSGVHHSVEESDLQSLRGDLEIWTPGLSLQLPDLSVDIFLRVIGHFWQQGRIIEGFSILAERGTFQLGGLAFSLPRSNVFSLHCIFILWRRVGVFYWIIL